MVMFSTIVIICVLCSTIRACKPEIYDGTPGKEDFRQIECEISTCTNVSRVIYKKTRHSEGQWMSVFESSNGKHTALDTPIDYSLTNRFQYGNLFTKQLLYIKPLLPNDGGKWKCVVFDSNNQNYESDALDLQIYVIPKNDSISISPLIRTLLPDKAVEFRCKPGGFFPQPAVVWKVNGVEQKGGVAMDKLNNDGIWSVENYINLEFDTAGSYIISCIIQPQTSSMILQKDMSIEVRVPECKPSIDTGSKSELHVNGHVSFQCDISTCHSVSKMIFEKSETFKPHTWAPVYEPLNTTYFMSVDTDNEQTVENKTTTDFQVLNIESLQLKDQGKWRCVVYDLQGIRAESQVMDLFIATAEPTPSIRPSEPTIVTNQNVNFTCIVNGIYPEPEVVWIANGEELSSGIAYNKQIKGGLWFIRNTIETRFHSIGDNTLSCVLNTNSRTPLQTHILVNVKEAARILHPSDDRNITANSSTQFILNCTGSGYDPQILWKKDGKIISEHDESYSTETVCTVSHCVGTIAPNPGDTSTECVSMDSYSGIYQCVIILKEPYQSSQASSNMEVFMKSFDCPQQYPIMIIVVVAVFGFMLVTLVPIIWSVVRRNKRQDTETSPEYEEVGDIIPNFVPPNSSNSETKQTYEEINDAIVHTIPPFPVDMLDTDRYSHCSMSEKSSEHSYDVCSTEIQTVAKGQIGKNYLSMRSEVNVTCTSKDTEDPVTYKRMDGQGNATYVTKEEVIGIEYIKMESLSCDAYVNNDAVVMNTKSCRGSPKYVNREATIKYHGIVQQEPETLEDIITSIDKTDMPY